MCLAGFFDPVSLSAAYIVRLSKDARPRRIADQTDAAPLRRQPEATGAERTAVAQWI